MDTVNYAPLRVCRGEEYTGLYRIIMVSLGGTKRTMYTGLTEEVAVEICENLGWTACPDGGYEWDLEIEEED